jgi:hypothetical protein
MYTFDPESESIKASYDIIPEAWNPRNNVDILMASFSSDGNMFAYIVVPILPIDPIHSNREGRVTAQNFYTDVEVKVEPYTRNQMLELFERKTYRIENRSITCITPCKSISGEYHDASRYEYSGLMMKHEFLIGCDDGSLRLIDVITVRPSQPKSKIRVEEFIHPKNPITKSVYEWNGGRDKITCLAIHPLLPLFASGSRDAAQLWAFESKELETLPLQPASPLSCVGFNYKFLAVCGSGGVRVYSCNSDDYRGYEEKKEAELQSGQKISDFTTELTLLNQQGDDCSICLQPMNDPPTQPAIRSGPEEIQEGYLTCGHKFHTKCIKDWFKDGKTTCPFCRKEARLDPLLTPDKFGEARKLLKYQQAQQGAESIVENFKRRGRYVPHGYVPHVLFGEPAAAPEPRRRIEQEQRSENSGGGIKNKYSRKKYNSKKSKIRRHYSKKNKN